MDKCKKQPDIDITTSSDGGNVNGLDLIRRQAAIDAMMQLQDEDIEAYGCEIPECFDSDRAIKALKELPSAEPVIRCKDCKHWYSDADTGMACEFTNMGQPEDGFCNWAERKKDE